MARRTVDSKMLSLYLDWFYMCMHYICIALARAPTWQSGRSASVQAGRIGSIVVWHGYARCDGAAGQGWPSTWTKSECISIRYWFPLCLCQAFWLERHTMTPLWRCTASDSRPAGPAVFFVCGLYGAAYTMVRLICRHLNLICVIWG